MFDGDRDAVERQAVDERGGAVDGIDNPAVFTAGMRAGLFAADGVVGVAIFDLLDEKILNGDIRLGDQIFDGAFAVDLYLTEPGTVLKRNLAGFFDDLF